MRRANSFAAFIALLILCAGAIIVYATYTVPPSSGNLWTVAITVIVALIASSAIKIADQWEKALIFRLGCFSSLGGPGLFFIIPIVETIPYWIDTRLITTTFKAEKTLTKDTVPVDVDAV